MSMNVPETVTAIALPKGFRYASAACGLRRKNRLDLGLIIAEQPVPAAGIFTQNLVKAAPVLLCQKHLETAASRVRAIVVNSGNANCAVGPSGMRASLATARSAAKALGCTSEQVLVCSTGVIGVPLPVEKILAVLPELAKTAATAPTNYDGFMQAILTTDTRPKWAAAACLIGGKQVRLIGCAKGAGMIHPNMATMLAYIVTDAAAPPQVLHQALTDVASRTFNSITVDGDTSTNDTALLLASGASGAPSLAASGRDFEKFVAALEKVCHALALAIVSDGEGASRVVEIEIRGAPDQAGAEQVARTIATSPLVKTAIAGGDPNWGRIVSAAGYAGVPFHEEDLSLKVNGVLLYRSGAPTDFDAKSLSQGLRSNRDVLIELELTLGQESVRFWTSDLTAEYVRLNADYTT